MKGCSDILLCSSDRSKVLLGKRKVEPQPDWWFIGGRTRPGETTTAAAKRNVLRELGMDFDENRFQVLANYNMVWSYRAQDPITNGTADISTIHIIYLSEEEEKADIPSLDVNEYHESKWWEIEEIQGERFHPCLINAVKALKSKRAFEALEMEVDKLYISDKDVVKRAVDFVNAMRDSKPDNPSVKVIFDQKALKYVYQN